MKELLIVGGGPAGITAAVYSARKKIDFSVVSKDIGGQAAWSGDIENYTGFQFITGPDLAKKFKEHMDKYKFDLHEGITVEKIEKKEGFFAAKLSEGGEIEAKSLIIASGKKPKELGVPGEKEFKNRGVAYCATCDGPIFSGKNVAIVGGGNSALDAAMQMMKIAKKTYVLNMNDLMYGDQVMIDKVLSSGNVEMINGAKTTRINGDKFVKSIEYEKGGNLAVLDVSGIFVEIGLVPNTGFIDFVEKNEKGEIYINCGAETSCPGVFAAGDSTDVPDKQIVIAAGDGAKAALSAFRYLSKLR